MITSIMGKPRCDTGLDLTYCQNVSASLLLTFFAKSLILKLRWDKDHRITALSTAAQKILNLAPGNWYIGMHIQDVLHSPRITAAVCSSQSYIDEIVPYGNTHLSFKKVALLLHGEEVGCASAFPNATQLQETEIKLRGKEIYERGHIAKYTFESIVGVSSTLKAAIDTARAYASTASDILIIGQSGTGKQLFAQSIHNASSRSAQPFVAINCAALPENLLESELFGYVAGAFTGANKNGKLGLFEQAHRGTIFLDESYRRNPTGIAGPLAACIAGERSDASGRR